MEVLPLLLGWLLGTLTPGIAESIRGSKRRGALLDGAALELHELRFTVALVYENLRDAAQTLNKVDLDLLGPIYKGYQGTGDDKALAEGLREALKKGPDAYLKEMTNPARTNKTPLSVPYDAPILRTAVNESPLFPLPVLTRLLRIDSELRLFNGQVSRVHKLFDLTFSLSGANYELNDGNLKQAQHKLVGRARSLVEAINAFVGPTGARLE